ncbi:DUF6512 family protein [Abyssisolibacter fermentans]|uniref:DUF6512 family protein n=1 Tax=Abyssisolibacter fermentans TaxID=1766203 RepID=UPI000831F26F|nr:DUF6512 family protein [Abyssisolibacter fermentans]
MKNKFNLWYIIKSSFVIFILASCIHSLYDLTGFGFLKPFVPVNESVWEHLKMIFYAGLVYGVIEYLRSFRNYENFFVARGISTIIMTALIPLFHYGYTYFTGRSIVWVDILITYIIVFIGQLIFRKIITNPKSFKKYNKLIFLLIILIVILFSYFTYYPPNLKIFIPES